MKEKINRYHHNYGSWLMVHGEWLIEMSMINKDRRA